MGSSFSLTLLWPGKSARPTPRVKMRLKCVFIHHQSVLMNSEDIISALKADGWVQVAQKRKSCPVQASDQTGAGDGASPAERYSAWNIQKHRKASRSEAEIDEMGKMGRRSALREAEE